MSSTPARVAGHALHPLLVVAPVGLFATSVVWDVVYLASGDEVWARIAFFAMAAANAGALLAAVPGWLDLRAARPDEATRRLGRRHATLSLGAVGLCGLSLALRWAAGFGAPDVVHMAWSWLGVALLARGMALGGRLVERLGLRAEARESTAPAGPRAPEVG